MQAHLPKAPDGILLIDSNPDIQLALTDLLEAHGYRVRCAASGAEAITAMEEGGPYATVLLDPALPDMDGIRLIKEVSGLDPHLPVIVLTGHVEPDHEIRAFHEGVLAFIRKPYNREQIIALLSRAVEVRKLGCKVLDMERALKESEEKFQLTVEHINDGVMYVDGSGVIVWANQQVGALLGHTLPNVIGHSLLEHVSPVGPSLKDSRVEQVLAVGTLNPMQAFKVTWPDGTQRWLEANVSDVVHQGKPTGQLLVVRDITESKLGEVALMERNHLLELDTEVASIIDDSNDIPTLLQGCAEALVRHLDAALARIWCLDDTKQVLQLHASAGLYTHLDGAHSRVPVGQYKIGLIAAEGKPILTNEVIGDSRIPEQAWAKREGLVAFAGYPLLSQQEVLGVMALFARHPLPAVTLNSLATVAHRITVGLERQKATEENTRLVRFTQSLLASAGEGIYGLDLDGHTTFVNPAAATMLGYTPEELLGTPMHERVHHSKPDGTPYPRETCPMYAAFNDGMVHQVEDEVLWRKDGTSFPVSYMSTPRWEDGQLVGAVVTFQDISERKQAEATIRKSEQRFRAIYDQAPVGIAILDSVSGQFQDINKQYCDIVGYSQEEMLSRSFQSITHPKDLQLDLDNMQKLLSGETSFFKMEKRYIRKDGNIIWVALTCVPLWLEDADPRSHIAIVEDITKQKQAEEKIFQQQAKLRTLSVEVALAEERERKRIAAVLHDDIGQNLALLKLKLGFLQDIHHSIKKSVITAEGLDLIEQTIASTRTLTYGLVSPLLYELGFAEGIQNLCEQIQDRHPEMHIQFQLNDQSLKLSDQMSIVLFRIIRELLLNIEKHAGATNAELKINVRDKQLHITLKDDGVGFDITNLGKEFSSEGGFGLFSIQEQVRGLGGIFGIRSTLGKGTQVFLTMPYSSSI